MGGKIAKIQAPFYYKLMPGHTIFSPLKKIRRAHAQWTFKEESEHFEVIQCNKDKKKMKIIYYTPQSKWIDVIDIKYKKDENLIVDIISRSSGLMPASIPILGPILSLLIFFPFSDHRMNFDHIEDVEQVIKNKKNMKNFNISWIEKGGPRSSVNKVKPKDIL